MGLPLTTVSEATTRKATSSGVPTSTGSSRRWPEHSGLEALTIFSSETYGEGYRTFEFKRPGFSARGFVFKGPLGRSAQDQTAPEAMGKLSRYLIEKLTGVELPQSGMDVTEAIYLTPQEAKEGGPYPYYYRKKSKKLVVTLPQGIREGQRIRLAGMGEEGKGGAKPGDLYLTVKIRKPLMQKLKDWIHSSRSVSNR